MNYFLRKKLMFTKLLMLLGMFFTHPNATAQSVATASPTSFFDVINDWMRFPGNGFYSDNLRATISNPGEYITYSNFSICIPAGSTINGIEIRYEGNASNVTSSFWKSLAVSLSSDGGTNYTPAIENFLPFSEVYRSIGGSTNLWNRTWTASDFGANFRVKVDVTSGNGIASLDHIEVKVYYSLPGGYSIPTSASPQIFTSSGCFTVPTGVTSITVKSWGGGGGTFNVNDRTSGGGGGGAYARATFPVSEGTIFGVVVGNGGQSSNVAAYDRTGGDSYFESNVRAKGGLGGSNGAGAGGLSSASIAVGTNTAKFSGGTGGSSWSGGGGGAGGGGGSAFESANGGNGASGLSYIGGNGGSGTGQGGAGGSPSDGSRNGGQGQAPGGGGGGLSFGGNGGAGADGQVIITWVACTTLAPTVGTVPAFCSGDNKTVADLVTYVTTTGTLNWYNSSDESIQTTTALIDGATYKVSQTVGECEGPKASIIVTVNTTPGAPTVGTVPAFCSGDNKTVADLVTYVTTTGTLNWYNSSDESVPTTTSLVNGATYKVSQTVGECEGSKTSIIVTVNTTPGAPTVGTLPAFCSGANKTVADLVTYVTTTGTLNWYNSSDESIPTNTVLVDGATYKVSKTENECEGPKESITVTVYQTPGPPTVASPLPTFCSANNSTIETLAASVTGQNLKWYNSSDAPIQTNTVLVNGTTYKVSQTENECEGPKESITVTVNQTPGKPTVGTVPAFCSANNSTIETLAASVTGQNLKWYNSSDAPIPTSTVLVDGATYKVSQTENECEGPKESITVTVSQTPGAPTVASPVPTFCSANNSTIATLAASVTGSNLQWYNSSDASIPTTTALVNGATYKVSQTVNGCEGPKESISVSVFTTPNAPTISNTNPQPFCSANSPTVGNLQGYVSGGNRETRRKWYNSSNEEIATTTALSSGTYRVSFVYRGCEGPKSNINVTVFTTPDAPTVDPVPPFCSADNRRVSYLTQYVQDANTGQLKWYNSSDQLIYAPLLNSNPLLVTGIYKVARNVSGYCEGPKTSISVVVNQTPGLPTVGTVPAFCSAANRMVSDLASYLSNYTGTLTWYNNSDELITDPATTHLVNGATYKVSQTVLGCEGSKASITVTVNTTPGAPTVGTVPAFCSAANRKVSDLASYLSNYSGTLNWYTNSDELITDPATTSLVNAATYKVSQTVGGCEGPKASVTVTVNTTPGLPTVGTVPSFCSADNKKISDLASYLSDYTGTLKWYNGSDELITDPTTTSLVNGATYKVSQTVGGCEGSRASISVAVNTTPVAPAVGTVSAFCVGDNKTVADLVTYVTTTGTLNWYNSSEESIPTITALVNGATYKVSQTVGGCEGSKASISVNTIQGAPTVGTVPAFCSGDSKKVSDLAEYLTNYTGTLKWYTNADVAIATPSTTALVNGATYKVSQTVSGCEGPKASVAVTVNTSSTVATSANKSANNVCPGTSVTLTVTGGSLGTGAKWVWYTGSCGDTKVGDGVGATGTLSVSPLVTTTYFVRAEGTCGNTTCVQVTVTVKPPTSITKYEIDGVDVTAGLKEKTIIYGCQVPELKVTASGTQRLIIGGFSYQWYINTNNSNSGGTSIPLAIYSTLKTDPGKDVGTYYYYVVVTGGCGSFTSDVMTVIINPQPADGDPVAKTYYTGPKVAWTPTSTSNTATVTLSAFLQNKVGAECGDISKARVTFMYKTGTSGTDQDWTPIPSAQNLPVNFVDPNNPAKGGTAAAIVQLSLSSSESSKIFDIKVKISGNYTNDGETTGDVCALLVGKLLPGGAIGGGATLCNAKSTGYVKGIPFGTTACFGVQYVVRSGKVQSPKGNVTLYIFSFNDKYGNNDFPKLHCYYVKSNAIATLAIKSPSATFTAKANIAEINLHTGLMTSMEGNLTMVIDMTDGSPDKVGVTVHRNAGGIWYSNNWETSKTVPVAICAGDVSVTGLLTTAPTIANSVSTSINLVITKDKVAPGFTASAYPNPAAGAFNIKIESSDRKAAIRVSVFDISGRIVETFEKVNAGTILRVGDKYRNGTYVVQLKQGDQIRNIKVIRY